MGVKSLWRLLRRSGTSVDLEELQGKRVAVDTSIWLAQVMAALRDQRRRRDDDGDASPSVARNAHVAGLFLRLCKLMHYGVRPVFVFDGATPAIKQRTTRSRHAQRQRQDARKEAQAIQQAAKRLLDQRLQQLQLLRSPEDTQKRLRTEQASPDQPKRQRKSNSQSDQSNSQSNQSNSQSDQSNQSNQSNSQSNQSNQSNSQLSDDDNMISDEDGMNDWMKELEFVEEEPLCSVPADSQTSDEPSAAPARSSETIQLLEESDGDVAAFESYYEQRELRFLELCSKSSEEFSSLQLHGLLKSSAPARGSGDSALSPVEQAQSKSIVTQDGQQLFFHKSASASQYLPFVEPPSSMAPASRRPAAVQSPTVGSRLSERSSPFKGLSPFSKLFESSRSPSQLASAAVSPSVQSPVGSSRPAAVSSASSSDEELLHDDSDSDSDSDFDMGNDECQSLPQEPSPAVVRSLFPSTPRHTDIVVQLVVSDSDTDDDLVESAASFIELSSDEDVIQSLSPKQAGGGTATARGRTPSSDDDVVDLSSSVLESSPSERLRCGYCARTVERSEFDSHLVQHPRCNLFYAANKQQSPSSSSSSSSSSQAAPTSLTRLLAEEQARLAAQTSQVSLQLQSSLHNEIVQDCAALLHLFGVPYYVAPFEAEAQCAHLNRTGVVDAVITDDSDAFLFGADVVYRNVFSRDGPEKYTLAGIEAALGLDRAGLVDLALLLGSDYTDGVAGVGPVVAMEILAAYRQPGRDALAAWRDNDDEQSDDPLRCKFVERLRTMSFQLPDGFPAAAVRQAYFDPHVGQPADFVWRKPDLAKIRAYAKQKLDCLRPEQIEMHLRALHNSVQGRDRQLTLTPYLRPPLPLTFESSSRIDAAISLLLSIQ